MARCRWILALATMVVCGVATAEAQVWERSAAGSCDEDWGGRNQERVCVLHSADLDDADRLTIDGGLNGGVSVEGWSRDIVEVRAKAWANARDEARAEELVREIRITADRGRLRAEGPDTGRRESWGVSWEVMVPHDTDLDLETHNGGITISDVNGRIRFDALNGGVHLRGTGGDVEGHTTNGGLNIELLYDHYRSRGVYFTSHLNENNRPEDGEIAAVLDLYKVHTYLDIYDGLFLPGSKQGGESLLGRRSVMAHCVHCQDSELARMAETETSISHCPNSQLFLGSGTMPWH